MESLLLALNFSLVKALIFKNYSKWGRGSEPGFFFIGELGNAIEPQDSWQLCVLEQITSVFVKAFENLIFLCGF